MNKCYSLSSKNWLQGSLLMVFVFSLTLNLQAQITPTKLWDKTFGGFGDDGITSLQQTADGGYILGGYSSSGTSGDKTQASKGLEDYWIVKIDASGNKTWDKSFGGSGTDVLQSMQQTSDGGYILGGGSASGISGDRTQASRGGQDYWVIKLDGSGNKLWDKSFGGNDDDRLQTIKQTSDGGYILAGWSYSGISGDKSQICRGQGDFWVLKLDFNGNKLWDKSFGGSSNDIPNTMQLTSDGGCIVGGYTTSSITGDFYVVKLDVSGNMVWDKTLGGSGTDLLYSIQQTPDGGYILGGGSASGISGDRTQANNGVGHDFWVVKLDANGNKTWDKSYGGSGGDWIGSMQQTSDGGYILGGTSTSNISGDKTQPSKGLDDFWVVKIDASGNKLWDKTFGGTNRDYLTSLQQTSDGGYILGGSSASGISSDKSQASKGGEDYWVIKMQTPAANDVAVTSITGMNSGCSLSNQETITIKVTNKGTAPQSNIPVIYAVNSTQVGAGTIAGPITPGDSTSFTFPAKADLSIPGNYSIEAKTVLAGDMIPANDASTKIVTSFTMPNAPTITTGGATTFCPGGSVTLTATSTSTGVSYKWQLNGTEIANATSATYTASTAGTYTAIATIPGTICQSPASVAIVVSVGQTPAKPTITAGGPIAICAGSFVTLTASTTTAGSTFDWFLNGSLIAGANSATYNATIAGSYSVSATLNGCMSALSTATNITVNPIPSTPTITQTGFVLTSSSTSGNQWYLDGVSISGATATTYTSVSNGVYTVIVNSNGCYSSVSNAVVISTTGIKPEMNSLNEAVFPNPSNGLFKITLPEGSGYELILTDLTGKVITQLTYKSKYALINISHVGKGLYLLKITGEGKMAMQKLVVE